MAELPDSALRQGTLLAPKETRTVKIFSDLGGRCQDDYQLLMKALEMNRDGQLLGQELKRWNLPWRAALSAALSFWTANGVQLLNLPTWEGAVELHPEETKRHMLMLFTKKAIDRALSALRDYCNLLKATGYQSTYVPALSVGKANGFLVDSDARIFDVPQR